jgi:hypothetical protein
MEKNYDKNPSWVSKLLELNEEGEELPQHETNETRTDN